LRIGEPPFTAREVSGRAGTRQRLMDGTIETIRRHGISGTSARSIASTAGVNQALVFYHFGSVPELITQACVSATRARVDTFIVELEAVHNLRQLLDLGRRLHAEECSLGDLTVLAQLLAAAQADPKLAEATAAALRLWIEPIERTLNRILAGSPLAAHVDTAGLATAVSAGFIGLELFEAVDPAGAQAALNTLENLAVLIDAVDELGPIAQRVLHRKLRATRR
jgi:AcrR family transcriptional regulator